MPEESPCCAGGRRERVAAPPVRSGEQPGDARDEPPPGMAHVPGGTFRMGTDDPGFPADGEGPVRSVELSPFHIDRHAVTVAEFLAFVRETGHTTDAERYGWSFVFEPFVEDADAEVLESVDAAPWWVAVAGANWLQPRGPGSRIESDDDRLAHPATHVSWRDAAAYAAWAGKRLPSEAEWERAARGGHAGRRFPWGDELVPADGHRCNVWQGTFPSTNTAADGYRGTAPVDAFAANGFGLYNVAGNVWEWCGDWFDADWHVSERAATRIDPVGPPSGTAKVMRGGSYLCHRSWCNRYRLAARTQNTPDSSTGNIGFRCAVDAS